MKLRAIGSHFSWALLLSAMIPALACSSEGTADVAEEEASSDAVTAGGIRGNSSLPANKLKMPTASETAQPYQSPLLPDAKLDKIMNKYRSELHPGLDVLQSSNAKIKVELPLKYWDVQGLGLVGTGDYAEVDKYLAEVARTYGSPKREAIKDADGNALLFVYGANFVGSSVGTLNSFFPTIMVKDDYFKFGDPDPNKNDPEATPALFTIIYNQSSPVNYLWKNEKWGVDTELANTEMNFRGNVKTARYKSTTSEGTMVLNLDKRAPGEVPPMVQMNEKFVFVSGHKRTVAPTYYTGERLKDLVPFDPSKGDVWSMRGTDAMNKVLTRVKFKPLAWKVVGTYSGVIDFPPQRNY